MFRSRAEKKVLEQGYDPARLPPGQYLTVTRWSRFDTSFRGVHWSEIAKLVRPRPSARYVVQAEQGFTGRSSATASDCRREPVPDFSLAPAYVTREQRYGF